MLSEWKWRKCEQALLFIAMHYWGDTSSEVKGRWGLLLPPCLLITVVQQPETSSPPFWLNNSSEGVTSGCAQPPSLTAPVLCHDPALWSPPNGSGGDSLPLMLRYSQLLIHPPLTSISVLLGAPRCSVLLQSHLQSPSNVDLAIAAGDTIYHIGLLTKR